MALSFLLDRYVLSLSIACPQSLHEFILDQSICCFHKILSERNVCMWFSVTRLDATIRLKIPEPPEMAKPGQEFPFKNAVMD